MKDISKIIKLSDIEKQILQQIITDYILFFQNSSDYDYIQFLNESIKKVDDGYLEITNNGVFANIACQLISMYNKPYYGTEHKTLMERLEQFNRNDIINLMEHIKNFSKFE